MRKVEGMGKRVCLHRTKGGCSICGRCFACCNCRDVFGKIIDFADRVRKRNGWFIGGFLYDLGVEWEEKYGQ